MVVAVAKARRGRARRAIICASTGNTSASAAAYGAAAGLEVVVVLPARPDRDRQAAPGARRRGAGRRRRRQLRRRAAGRPGAAPSRTTTRSTLVNSVNPHPARGPEDRPRSRSATTWAGRPTSSRSRSATPATSAPTGPGSASTRRPGSSRRRPRMLGFQAAGAAPLVLGRPIDDAGDDRDRDPDRQPGVVGSGRSPPATRAAARIEAVTDDEILAAYRVAGRGRGHLLRAVVGGEPRGGRRGWPSRGDIGARRGRRLRADGERAQGSRRRRNRSRGATR